MRQLSLLDELVNECGFKATYAKDILQRRKDIIKKGDALGKSIRVLVWWLVCVERKRLGLEKESDFPEELLDE